MNDTDTYDDKHRVAYHADPGTEDPAMNPSDPGGHGPEPTVRNGCEVG